MNPLRQQMQNDMVIRGMAARTQESYLSAVRGLAKYYRRPPNRIAVQEVQSYLLHLLQERGLSASTCNLVLNGVRFFYRITLGQTETEFYLPRPKQPQRLPQILSREEIAKLFEVTTNLKHRALLMTTYGAGLRVSEVACLKVTDIDSQRMTLRVEQGKGAKDRYTLLSQRLLLELRRYWIAYRPKSWLFPMRAGQHPIEARTVQKIYYNAKRKAQITKPCGIHGLRHAFATHLLEAGVDLYTIQRLSLSAFSSARCARGTSTQFASISFSTFEARVLPSPLTAKRRYSRTYSVVQFDGVRYVITRAEM